VSTILSPPKKPTRNSVISTDAIESLSPYVPDGRAAEVAAVAKSRVRKSRLRKSRVRGARLPLPTLSTKFQVLFTVIPLVIGDILAVLSAFVTSRVVLAALIPQALPGSFIYESIAIVSAYLLMATALGLYPATGSSPIWELRQQAKACCLSFLTVYSLRQLQTGFRINETVSMAFAGSIALFVVPVVRSIVRHHFQRYSWWGESVVIIGSGVQGQAIYNHYDGVRQRGLRPLGIVDSKDSYRAIDSKPSLLSHIPYLGSVRRLSRIGRRRWVRWGIVAPGGCDGMEMSTVMQYAANLPNVIILPSQHLLPSLWASPRECAGVMGVHVRDYLRSPTSLAMKRCFDIVLSAAALVMASPIILGIIVCVKMKSPGPVFFGHSRIGLGGKSFRAWKFRTMVVNADEVLEECLENDPEARRQWMEDQKLKDDPRIIKGVGHFMRKSSLDEIPQLWNILRGDMSLVGPRPIVTSEISRYSEMYPLYLRVRPGLSGLWQVSGRNNTSYEERVRLDSYYVCNWSIWLDIYIVARTFRTILLREGAY